MKKILGLTASPRKLGNCEIMIKEISRQIPEPHELQLIRLPELDIQPCKGCYRCLFKEEECVLNDDFDMVLKSMIEADALILSVPAYFLGANASLKRFLDRGLSFYAHIDKLWGKPAVAAGIAGIKGKEGYTLLCIDSFLKLVLADNKYSRIIYGALPGEIFFNDKNKKIASDMAASLFGTRLKKTDPRCPLCGGDTFRFLEGNRVRCMLCSNEGVINIVNKKSVFEIDRGVHELFLTKKDAVEHKKWLQGMKIRFIKEKKRLKEISLPYRKL
ncbi:MAG: flavodoxin family protein [Deltaproteobacteria bacterium]|nr:flavodoxin family protein [Deltaproteobacteria bacterium]